MSDKLRNDGTNRCVAFLTAFCRFCRNIPVFNWKDALFMLYYN